MKPLPLLMLAAALFSAPALNAATLVAYTFTSSSLLPTTQAADVLGGAFAFGPGLGSTAISTSSGNPLPSVFVGSDRTGDPVSPTSEDYVTFSLTAESGYVFTLESLKFDYAYTGGDASQSATFTLRSSVDGFTSNLGVYTRARTSTVVFETTAPAISLATLPTGLGQIEFRIYLTDTTSSSTSYLRMDNFVLEGTVTAVPEPGLLGVGLASGLLLMGRRLRRQTSTPARS